MARSIGLSLTYLVAICYFTSYNFGAFAVDPAVACQNATAPTVNGTKLLGTWYEVARKPIGGGPNTEQCVQVVIDHKNDNKNVTVSVTFNSKPSSLWVNQTINETLSFATTGEGAAAAEFNATFNVTAFGANVTLKILETDYTGYAFACAYVVNSTSNVAKGAIANSSIAGATILSRRRQVNVTELSNLINNAHSKYSDFTDLSNVTQSEKCYRNSAGTIMPQLTALLAIVYSIIKFVH